MLFRSKVKTIKARPPLGSHRGIMFSQPTHEGVHIGIAPHPCWKTLKGGLAIWSGRAVADIAVDACGVRPISFDRDDGKAILKSEQQTSELQSLIRKRYAVYCMKKNKQ